VTDTGEQKLNQLLSEFARLQLPAPQALRVDWTKGDETLPRDFDRVLVDAPCTGSGTLRRRPEIALRLVPEDVERLATLAEHILRNAAKHCKPDGRVLFVVCSVLARETFDVLERVSDVLQSVPFDRNDPFLTPTTTSIHLLPGSHGCDGFFLASLRPKQAC
jgi:16S rRNA (cytosine967-C5)-methyltransferase